MYLLVVDSSFEYLPEKLKNYRNENSVVFDKFTPNPLYEQVLEGVKMYKDNNCDEIIAIGGGSTIDVAKCIKLFVTLDPSINYLKQEFKENNIKLTAIPTTAGTGSEATKYAVIYYEGKKQSVTHESIIPSNVIFEPDVLKTLPMYQKKATMLDALSHSIESYWSVNSTDESKNYSKQALELILNNYDNYLKADETTFPLMQQAAFLAGKAINITQTTAGHAMCYKLTSLYKIAHGQACAMCVNKLYPFMLENIDKCIDSRGIDYLRNTFNELTNIISPSKFNEIYNSMNFDKIGYSDSDINILVESVNLVRLKNNPIKLDKQDLDKLYREILGE